MNTPRIPASRLNGEEQLNAAMAFGWICFILSTFAFIAFIAVGARSARSGNGFGAGLVA